MARRATFIQKIRKQYQNVLVFDAGNSLWSDYPLTAKTKGKIVIEAMNAMGYTAAVLGERDLLLGEEDLRARIQEAQFPILSANVLGSDGKLLAKPYVVLEIQGHRIGVLGLTGQSLPQGVKLQVTDPLEAAHKYVAELQSQADFIIALAHLGKEGVQKLVESEEAVDMVVWGGAKPPLPNPSWDQERQTLAIVAEAPVPGHAGRQVGFAVIQVSGSGQVIRYKWEKVTLTTDFADAPEILELLQKYSGD